MESALNVNPMRKRNTYTLGLTFINKFQNNQYLSFRKKFIANPIA